MVAVCACLSLAAIDGTPRMDGSARQGICVARAEDGGACVWICAHHVLVPRFGARYLAVCAGRGRAHGDKGAQRGLTCGTGATHRAAGAPTPRTLVLRLALPEGAGSEGVGPDASMRNVHAQQCIFADIYITRARGARTK